MEGEIIWWHAKHEKTGYEHNTSIIAEALVALEEASEINFGTGAAGVVGCVEEHEPRVRAQWWSKVQALAGLEPKRGQGRHSLNCKFATDLMSLLLRVPCKLGGWKNAQTVLKCYQQAERDSSGRFWRAAGRFAAEKLFGGDQSAGVGPPNPISSTSIDIYKALCNRTHLRTHVCCTGRNARSK